MVMEYININKLEKNMKVIGRMVKKVVKVNFHLLKVIFMKDNLNKDIKMDLVGLNINQAQNLKVILLMKKLKEKDKCYFLMVIKILVNIKMDKCVVMVNINFQTKIFIRVNLKMIN